MDALVDSSEVELSLNSGDPFLDSLVAGHLQDRASVGPRGGTAQDGHPEADAGHGFGTSDLQEHRRASVARDGIKGGEGDVEVAIAPTESLRHISDDQVGEFEAC